MYCCDCCDHARREAVLQVAGKRKVDVGSLGVQGFIQACMLVGGDESLGVVGPPQQTVILKPFLGQLSFKEKVDMLNFTYINNVCFK